MTITVAEFREHLNGVPDSDAVLSRFLAAAVAHIERLLGFKLDDAEQFPDGTPADLELAVLQLAGHHYENRESSAGAAMTAIPFGVADVVAEYRNYTFGHVEPANG